jgi:hypothetical protein
MGEDFIYLTPLIPLSLEGSKERGRVFSKRGGEAPS